MIKFNNFSFPKDVLFYIHDPNGGLWIKSEKLDNLYTLGLSSVVAEKIEKIENFKINHIDQKISKNSSFLKIEGPVYEMIFYSPFNCEIIEINPVLSKPINLSQESIYSDHWILKIKLLEFDIKYWEPANSTNFVRLVERILKADKQLREKCCPNFFDSNITRRKN